METASLSQELSERPLWHRPDVTEKNHEILLVEDDPGLREIVRLTLEGSGYLLTTAPSGEVAIGLLKTRNFDVVITDLFMHRVNGIAVLEMAKALNPDTMVIVMTGNSDATFAVQAVRAHTDDYLLKPFSLSELCDRVTACIKRLERKRKRAETEEPVVWKNPRTLSLTKIMAHDIRSLLVSMSARLKLLRRGLYGKMDEGVARKLDELDAQNVRLAGVAEDYLGAVFSAQTDDERERECEELDPERDVIEPVLEEMATEMRDFGVRNDQTLCDFPRARIRIRTNKTLLKAVFRNLFSNAIRHCGDKRIIAYGIDDVGAQCRLSVYNSGRPVPKEFRDRLFDPFAGMAAGSDGNHRGLGLGLTLVQEIVQGLGGRIWYEPCDGGSRIVFTIPRD